jgi:hypothetical protein
MTARTLPKRPEVAKTNSVQPLSSWTERYVPRTELGHKLLAARKALAAEGIRFLSEDEIAEEICERRGERYPEDGN